MVIFQNILAAIRGVLLIVMMALYLLGYAVTRIFWKHTKSSGLSLRRAYISQMAFPILNIKIKVEGKPFDGPALYVCNHRSFSDPIISSKFLNAFIIAKAEIADYPIINKGAEVTGIIWVKRTDRNSRANARREFVEVVKGGHNILVYPEGTVNKEPQLMEYKPGTFIEAVKNNIPIVPLVLEYRDDKDLWYDSGLVAHFFKQFGKLFTQSKLIIGPPMTSDDGIALRDKVQKWSQAQVNDMHKGWGSSMEKLTAKQV